MFPAILGRRPTKRATPDKAWSPPGPHEASVRAWITNTAEHSLALEMYREGPHWRCQTVPKNADNLRRELGESVTQALARENTGPGWNRADGIISAALDATGTAAFMDYLVAIGEISFKEGT